MFISTYQITEIIIGTFIFPLFYFLYIYLASSDTIVYWDIIWCTLSLFIILLFKAFYINFNILQTQNFSSNNILNDVY
jgi:hypothetical protein